MSPASYPPIILIGRPNVGKSTLFNRLIGKRKAIVEARPGTTRDCIDGVFTWHDKQYAMADTGGISFTRNASELDKTIDRARTRYLDHAKLVLLVCDAEAGCLAPDQELASMLRKRGLPVLVVVNKVDHLDMTSDALAEFSVLGFPDLFFISATHGLGIRILCDAIAEAVPGTPIEGSEKPYEFSLAILGEPNAGKSTLLNAVLGEERSAVSELAGTTRDPVESMLTFHGRTIQVVDTAGARRKRKIKEPVHFYSQTRTAEIIEKTDVVILLIDASAGMSRNVGMLVDAIMTEHRSCVVAVNKWDLISRVEQSKYRDALFEQIRPLQHCPVVFMSARNGKNIEDPFKEAVRLWDVGAKRIEVKRLMNGLEAFQRQHPHPGGVRIKFATQVDVSPPHFVLFVNRPEALKASYLQAVRNEFSRAFGLGGIFFKFTTKGGKGEK